MAETMAWLEPDGTSHSLSDPTTVGVLVGRQGAFMPPSGFIEDTVPLQPGSRLRATVVGPRVVDLPLLIAGADATALRARVREVLRWFDPTRGDGRLRVTGPDGLSRDLVCRYAQGLQISEASDAYRVTAQELVLSLRAFDPYWYAVAATVVAYTIATPPTFFPFFPLRLTSSTVFAAPVVANPGDADAHPIWTITGPGSGIVLLNETTGERIELATVLSAGDVVVIDTRPGVRTVVRGAENLFPDLSTDSWLWWLRSGDNLLRLEMSGATPASAVGLSFTARYLGV